MKEGQMPTPPGQKLEETPQAGKLPENKKPKTIDASSLYNKVGSSYGNGLPFGSITGKTEFIPWNEVFGAIAGGSHMGEQLLAKYKKEIIEVAEEMRDIANEVISVCEEFKEEK